MPEDYYDILGVARTATPDDIKRAFRKKAHQHHPDRAGGNEEAFKKVNEAYQVLSDAGKRAQYDQLGESFNGAGGNPFAGFHAERGSQGFNLNFEDLGNVGDIFSELIGNARGRTRTRVRRGSDIAIDVTISFAQSAEGVTQTVSPRTYRTCARCHGNTAEPGTPIDTCQTCQGTGSTTTSHQTPFGTFAQRTTCRACAGEGKIPRQPCRECKGEGRTLQSQALEINVPAGIADGQTLRIPNQGEAPRGGGTAGDLFVTVHVEADAELSRDGDNVRSTTTIPFADAALGTQIQIRTLAGEREVNVPPGTQPGTELRLPGIGFPSLAGAAKGDHIVTVTIEVPKRLSRQQRKLLEELKAVKPRKLFG
jgi:molecular chaperone DnaJ